MVTFSGKELMNTISPSSSSSSRERERGMDMELDDEPSGSHDRNGGGGGRKISEKSLDSYGFITGDYLSVSLYVPEPKLPSQSAPAGLGQGIRGAASRENPAGRISAPEGDWAKGEALPPPQRGGDRSRHAGNGRDGGYRGHPGPSAIQGMGIRGGARRSPSVERNGNGRRRSRSPDRRYRRN